MQKEDNNATSTFVCLKNPGYPHNYRRIRCNYYGTNLCPNSECSGYEDLKCDLGVKSKISTK